MKEQLVSKVYAKSLIELGQVHKVDIVSEMIKLTEIINSSNHLENLLFLEVFTTDEKKEVFQSLANKLNFSPLFLHSIIYLIDENRIGMLPLIIKEAVVIDDEKKGFIRGTIEGPTAVMDQNVHEKLKKYISKKIGREPQLSYVQNNNLTAGYRVTIEDIQLDASIDNQLEKFKQSIITE